MRLGKFLLAVVMAVFMMASVTKCHADASEPRSFSLSTNGTFAPGESVKIQLLAHNVPELEFRVYKVRDVQKFFAELKDLHSFGEQHASVDEQIDEKTWLERLHDFKSHLWWMIRRFFRGQFTTETRDSFRESQGKLGKKSYAVGVSQFALVPTLSDNQLVARWTLKTPPVIVSETHRLPIDGLSNGVYLIEATDGSYKAYTIAIVSNIAMVERTINGEANLYVADRKTGAPIAKADVSMWASGELQSSGATGEDGLATLAMKNKPKGDEVEGLWMLAKHGEDYAMVTPWGYGFAQNTASDVISYVYTDRPVYRPGHDVHIKAILRKKDKDTVVLPADKSVMLHVTDGDGKDVFKKDVPVSAHGTVTADLTLENDAILGYYTISIERNGTGEGNDSFYGGSNFYVEEYKKPEYQVLVKPDVQRVLQGNKLHAVIEAKYFFGEPVANAKVTWVIHTSRHYWWDWEDASSDNDSESGDTSESSDYTWGQTEEQEHDGVLDANGRLEINVPMGTDDEHNDRDVRIEARVTDVANREVSGHSTVLATYGSFRISVEPVNYTIEIGKPARLKVTAVNYDNKPIQTAVHLEAGLSRWDSDNHKYVISQTTSTDTSTNATGVALIDMPLGATSGDFQITATAKTPEGRSVRGRSSVWMWGGEGEAYTRENMQAQIVADKKSYQVGDTAHLLLVSQLNDAWAVLSAEGDTVQWRQVVHVKGKSFAFNVPITKLSQPNTVINAVIINNSQVITAQKDLKVPTVERTLTVTATPSKTQFFPGEKGSFDVLAVDNQGKPVSADLSFGEVDEALYAVRPDTSPNIVSMFYPKRYVELDPTTSFGFYFYGEAGLKSPTLAQLNQGTFHPRLAQVKPGSDLVVPKIRKAFPDTAYWNPNVRTGADGHARVEFNYPDSLTTWRTTIRAMTDDGKAGGMVTRVVVRKNLIVRLAAPRFFRIGDETVLRVIAHNYLSSAKDVTFMLDVKGLDVINGETQKVNIPARGESYVDWRVKSRVTGNAVLTAKALTNEESDAVEVTLPVEPFGVKQHQSGAGVIYSGDGQAEWNYGYPAGSDANTRGLTITVAPSVAGTVFDALNYLTEYPYGCTEQTMSGFMPDVIVSQAIDKLHLKPPMDRAILSDMVKAGLDRLYSYQHDDGGWGWWQDDKSTVFMTAYVVSGMGQARDAGYTVDDGRLNNAREWLKSMLSQHPNMLADLRAYVVYALATTGGAPKDALDAAWSNRSKASDEGLALTGLALDAAKDSRAKQATSELEQKVVASGSEAHWTSHYDELMETWSDTTYEATAFAIKLIVRQDKTNTLLVKAASWLAKNRSGDYWYSTKQTSMVVQGLTDYLALSGELNNASDIEIFVNGNSVGKKHFGAGDGFAPPWKIKLVAGQVGSGGQVTIRKSGNGLAYWSSIGTWYSADKRLFQKEKLSLNITRDYYLLQKKQDKPTDEITYNLVPLNGQAHVGDIIAVRLAVGGSEWKYLMAEDPIPAGTEFLDKPELYKLNKTPSWWTSYYTHKEFHDDRASFFNSYFNDRHEYVYLLKVVNPGKFAISPAQTEPMYQDNVQATTDPATLEVQP